VRAFNPFPVAQGVLKGEVCRIWMATAKFGKAKVGKIVSVHDGVTVGCGDGLLNITELQAPGGKRLSAQAFVQGHNLQVGDLFS
jgi:methionyl-tRNA formyltransferase